MNGTKNYDDKFIYLIFFILIIQVCNNIALLFKILKRIIS